MPLQPARPYARDPHEPVLHELPPFRFEGVVVEVRAAVIRGEDGIWRGRLRFRSEGEGEAELETAEIFCAVTEPELWQSVRGLGSHHIRDLYRSLR
ncbi:MAG TPA: hypothetical protein VFS28_02065 [Gemmatimonadales bacterium]|jgi:hypothetical protein|nr:hypothetical protein [Gemmatimonadales bacterium]